MVCKGPRAPSADAGGDADGATTSTTPFAAASDAAPAAAIVDVFVAVFVVFVVVVVVVARVAVVMFVSSRLVVLTACPLGASASMLFPWVSRSPSVASSCAPPPPPRPLRSRVTTVNILARDVSSPR